MHDDNGYIVVLEDFDIKALLRLRADHELTAIDDYLDNKMKDLVM